jgi:PAS domain S-box-containing protein
MNAPWSLIVFVDIAGSVLMLMLSCLCALYAWQLIKNKPDDVFRNFIFLFTLSILFFSVSRSFGHLVKQILLLNGMESIWAQIAPFSGAVNSTTFIVIFALSLSFNRFQKVHSEIEHYKDNLEVMIKKRTTELENSKNTLENILNNSNPINITTTNFDLIQANEAYYSLWPNDLNNPEIIKCYESRPGDHCHTDECPLKLIIDGSKEVVQEVSKDLSGEIKDFIITARPFHDVDGKLIGMVESFQDITQRKRAEKAMQDSEERFRQIFQSNPDPVILARLQDGTILDVNKAFETATGITRVTALGHNSEELALWADHDQRESFRKMLQTHGEVDNYEANFRVPGGQNRTTLVSARVLNLHNDSCILLVIRDITTEKAAERVLIEMDQMKSELITTAAHELNTPLSAIMGYTELLLNPEITNGLSEKQKQDFLHEVYDKGEALNHIIDNLLDIGRIDCGQAATLDLHKTNFIEVLSKSVDFFRFHDKEHTYILDLPKEEEESLLTIDRHRINQVLENLLSNAMKYSPGGTEIILRGRRKQEGWEVRIIDQGIGMEQEQLDHIYDKFYRADSSDTSTGGLGLGMSVAKQIVESHNGEIRVESAMGEGTTVIFNLPFSTS